MRRQWIGCVAVIALGCKGGVAETASSGHTGVPADSEPTDSEPGTSSDPGTDTDTGTPPDTDPPTDDIEPYEGPYVGDGFVPELVISEVQTSNLDGLTDEDGESPDWIELQNRSGYTIDLAGYGLSDDPDDPFAFTFPSVVLAPGATVVVFASGSEDLDWTSLHTVVDQGHSYAYRTGAQGVPPTWPNVGLDEGPWSVGVSGFGYGDGDDATELDADQIFTRGHFTVDAATLADATAVWLHMDYDDGFVAYLNGTEIARRYVGSAGVVPTAGEFAWDLHEASLYAGVAPEAFAVDPALLAEGDNLLAVSVHNHDAGSSDLSLIPFLSLELATLPATPSTVLGADALHAGFKLAAEGELVSLTSPTGLPVDALDTGRQYADMSVGRDPHTGERLFYLEPTPGAPNTTEGRPGFASLPTFSPPPGLAPGEVTVEVRSDAGALVTTTTDGQEPTEDAAAYTGPLTLAAGPAARTVRARAFVDGLWPSRVATATYLDAPPNLPVWSLVTEPANLWDPATGIYVGDNVWNDWERPLHLEFFETDGSLQFSTDAGVKIHGGASRDFAQKSLRLLFRSGYGAGALEYPLFGADEVAEFSRLLLRNGGHDWCYTMVRDATSHALLDGVDVDHQAYRPTVVYLNGEYWGIHNVREKLDRFYVETHHGEDPDALDILEFDGWTVGEGSADAYVEMVTYAATEDLSDPAHYAWVADRMDIDEYVLYVVTESWVNNYDWPGNNIKFWRPHRKGGKWRWMMYDTESGYGNWGIDASYDMVNHMLTQYGPSWPNPAWSNELFRNLMDNPEFHDQYVNTFADGLNTRFDAEHVLTVFEGYRDAIAPELPAHQARWGYTMGTHYYEVGVVTDFIEDRELWVRRALRSNLGLGADAVLTLDVDPPGAGSIQLQSIKISETFAGTYFSDVPVPLTAVAAEGWTFVGWSDGALGASPDVEVLADGGAPIVALFEALP